MRGSVRGEPGDRFLYRDAGSVDIKFLKREVVHTEVALVSPTAPSSFGSAPHNVQWRSKAHAAPHKETCQYHAEMRFLRFQAPWADGRNVFALLRNALADTWANGRSRLMDGAKNTGGVRERQRVHDAPLPETRVLKNVFSCRESRELDVVRSSSDVASGRAFFTRALHAC